MPDSTLVLMNLNSKKKTSERLQLGIENLTNNLN